MKPGGMHLAARRSEGIVAPHLSEARRTRVSSSRTRPAWDSACYASLGLPGTLSARPVCLGPWVRLVWGSRPACVWRTAWRRGRRACASWSPRSR
eukprot:scaffold48212_cov36-Phaeocystis_antarctica.AAC.1